MAKKRNKKKQGKKIVISEEEFKKASSDLMELVAIAVREGYSITDIVRRFEVDRDKVQIIQDQELEIAKQNALSQRILFRQDVRDKMNHAKKFMSDVMKGDYDFEPHKRTSLKLRAAQSLLSFGKSFIDEDPLTLYVEAPTDNVEKLNKPHFEVGMDETGKTTFDVDYVEIKPDEDN